MSVNPPPLPPQKNAICMTMKGANAGKGLFSKISALTKLPKKKKIQSFLVWEDDMLFQQTMHSFYFYPHVF